MSTIQAGRRRTIEGWWSVALLVLPALLASGASMAQTVTNQPAVAPAARIPWLIASSGPRLKLEDAPAIAASEDTPPVKPGRVTNEGLKVHGHWVIDVKDPDGTLAQHREFENGITQSGQAYLTQLLAGYSVAGDYAIQLYGGATPSPCGGGGCFIAHSYTTNPGSVFCGGDAYSCSATLTYAFSPNYSNGNSSMVLSGYIMVPQTGQIAQVATIAGTCPAFYEGNVATTASPANCLTTAGPHNGALSFTSTALTTPINVTTGQIVQVSVTITFS